MSERTGEALVFRWTRTIMDGSSAAGQMRLRKDGSGTYAPREVRCAITALYEAAATGKSDIIITCCNLAGPFLDRLTDEEEASIQEGLREARQQARRF